MPAIIIESSGVDDVVRMFVVDEVSYLFAVFFVILAVFLIVDLGFDIEESGAPVSVALATMTLRDAH